MTASEALKNEWLIDESWNLNSDSTQEDLTKAILEKLSTFRLQSKLQLLIYTLHAKFCSKKDYGFESRLF
jgi:hypothetical protein